MSKTLPFMPADFIEYKYKVEQINATYYFLYNESDNQYEFGGCDFKTKNPKYTLSDFIALQVLTDEMTRNLKSINKFLKGAVSEN